MDDYSQSSGEVHSQDSGEVQSQDSGEVHSQDSSVKDGSDNGGSVEEEVSEDRRWNHSSDDDDHVYHRDSYAWHRSYRERRKKQKLQKEDRISNMPDAILIHILSFLSTRAAVTTGTLSRRWQYLWTSVPTLYFVNFRSCHRSTFVSFVNQTLMLHSCKIKKFVLDFDYKESYNSDVNLWIRFATRANVEELCLEFNLDFDDCDTYPLPQHIYSNSLLKKLNVSFCDIMPHGSIDWKSVKSLKFHGTRLSEEVLQNILLGSPVLEVLELCEISAINSMDICSASLRKLVITSYTDVTVERSGLEIIAPNVESLELSGSMLTSKCSLMNVSSLIECNLSFEPSDNNDSEEHQTMVKKLCESICHVEKLTLGASCIENLSKLVVRGSLYPWSSHKCLMLDMCIQEIDLPHIECVLELSPHLETLIINMDSPRSQFYHDFNGEHYRTSLQRDIKCLRLHLKTVKIIGFRAWESDECNGVISLAQFLLKGARVLEKMIIKVPSIASGRLRGVHDLENLYHMTQKLLSFPRISRQAYQASGLNSEFLSLKIGRLCV